MAGFNDNFYFDSCFIRGQNGMNDGISNYYLNYSAVMPPKETHAPLLSRGSQPTFWGPANTSVVHKESLLQGRAQPLSRCPSTDVIYLPDSEFPQTGGPRSCYRSDLEPIFDAQPRSCQSVSEVDTSAYSMFPGGYQKGFVSINTVAQSFLPTRMAVLNDLGPCVNPQASRTSYGSYTGNGYSFM